MYIDGDTHYWPLRFIDKVKHPGKGHLEIAEDKGNMVRYGEVVPGRVATYYRGGKKRVAVVTLGKRPNKAAPSQDSPSPAPS